MRDSKIRSLTEEFESLGLIRPLRQPPTPADEETFEEEEEPTSRRMKPRGRRLRPLGEMGDTDSEDYEDEMDDEDEGEGEGEDEVGSEPFTGSMGVGDSYGNYSMTPQSSPAGTLTSMKQLAGSRTTENPGLSGSLPPVHQIGSMGGEMAMESTGSIMGDIRGIVERLGDPTNGDYEAAQRIFENITAIAVSLGNRLRESDPLRPTLFSLAEDSEWYKANVTKLTLESERNEIEEDVKKMVLDLVDIVEELRDDIEEDVRSRGGFRSK